MVADPTALSIGAARLVSLPHPPSMLLVRYNVRCRIISRRAGDSGGCGVGMQAFEAGRLQCGVLGVGWAKSIFVVSGGLIGTQSLYCSPESFVQNSELCTRNPTISLLSMFL